MDSKLEKQIRDIINTTSREGKSNIPDIILAHFVMRCLDAFEEAINARNQWYGVKNNGGMMDKAENYKDFTEHIIALIENGRLNITATDIKELLEQYEIIPDKQALTETEGKR